MGVAVKSFFNLTMLLVASVCVSVLTGCASPKATAAAKATTDPNVFPIVHHGSPSTSISVEVGPYRTTSFGNYSALALRKEPIRCVEQVSFCNDRLIYEYDVENRQGIPAHVQVGFEKTNETFRLLGMVEREKGGRMFGAITRDEQLLGKFTLAPLETKFGARASPSAGHDILLSDIETPVGLIRHYSHVTPVEQRSGVGRIFQPPPPIVFEYRIGDRTVARRDASSFWFADELSDEARICIIAEMVIYALRERTEENAQRASEFNTSVLLMSR